MTKKILSGLVALVTGASSGIGDATARALANAGAKVAVAARRKDRLDALANDIKQMGGEALAIAADLVHEDESDQAQNSEDSGNIGRWCAPTLGRTFSQSVRGKSKANRRKSKSETIELANRCLAQ